MKRIHVVAAVIYGNLNEILIARRPDHLHQGGLWEQCSSWMMTKDKLGSATFMHCLPVRRNVVVECSVLDSEQSAVIKQSNNRTYAAQLVLKKILENEE